MLKESYIQNSDSTSCVYGVIYSIDVKQIKKLDEYEGLGYGYLKKEAHDRAGAREIFFRALTIMLRPPSLRCICLFCCKLLQTQLRDSYNVDHRLSQLDSISII